MTRRVVIIADSLTNDFMGREERFVRSRVHLGPLEVGRLMGEGDAYGTGPLAGFLRAAGQASHAKAPIHLIFLRDWHDPENPDQKAEMARFGVHNLQETPGAAFIGGIEEALEGAHILNTGALSMPVFPFLDVLEVITGFSPRKMTDACKRDLIFILVGAHTDIRVYHTAFTLRHDYQFPQVVVCQHLVGSPNHLGHEQYLQANYSDALVHVEADLQAVYELAGLKPNTPIPAELRGCVFSPPSLFEGQPGDYQQVLRRFFLFQACAELKKLGGGYSGSLLVTVSGTDRQGARLAPVIVKIDRHDKIQREIEGYHRVRHLMGNHIPHFHTPVSHGDVTGIRMDVATMAGLPVTFQKRFETTDSPEAAARFLRLLKTALTGLVEQVLENRRSVRPLYPYRELGLHTRQQQVWLQDNLEHLIPGFALGQPRLNLGKDLAVTNPLPLYARLVNHADRLQVPVSLCHGDLNLANLITDEAENWWIIDWSYAAEGPVERDLAKLENDLKFVLMKEVREADYPRLLELETFLISRFILPPVTELPATLAWVREDLRWKTLYESLRMVRECAGQAGGPQRVPEMYDIFLVKFAAHTLSFDQRRISPHTGQPRGECTVPMMSWALISLSLLLEKLERSSLHTRVLRDRLAVYPERFSVPSGMRSWDIPFSGYQPPYCVLPVVLENDCRKKAGGWADPEDIQLVPELFKRTSLVGALRFDDAGRPLNPNGRTGLAGRGFWGRWGPNAAADPVVTRLHPRSRELEILLVKRESAEQWGLPGGILLGKESPAEGAGRSLRQKTGVAVDPSRLLFIDSQVVEDFRNTDHAWVESQILHAHLGDGDSQLLTVTKAPDIADVDWCPLNLEFTRSLFANHLAMIRQTLSKPEVQQRLPQEIGPELQKLLLNL